MRGEDVHAKAAVVRNVCEATELDSMEVAARDGGVGWRLMRVSYTHLTLPTTPYV